MSNALKLGSPLKLYTSTSNPSGPEDGLLYYNTTDDLAKIYANGTWEQLATKSYADALAAGFDPKQSCVRATTAALPAVTYANGASGVGATLTADANGALAAQDGGALTVGQRLLVKNQAAALQNGIYTVTDLGGAGPFILTRATDFDGSPANEVDGGEFTFISNGTTLAGSAWVVYGISSAVTFGTTAIDWTQVKGETTLQNAYVAGETITTNVTDGSVIIAGTQSLQVSATLGLDMTDKKITTTNSNQRIFIAPHGTGALVAESTTTTAGNARGIYAVDLQLLRGSATYVASGASSALLGGDSNRATGSYSSVVGGNDGAATGAGTFIGGGVSATASGANSAVLSGQTNTASGGGAVALGGISNVASGTYAIAGGAYNKADNAFSIALGAGAFDLAGSDFVLGNNNSASSTASSAVGVHFRVAGDTSDVHIGRLTNQSAVAGAANKLFFHTILASSQSRAVSIKAPDTLAASYGLTLPADDGLASQFLQTDGSGVLSWATVASDTLQSVYDADVDNTDATITTNATDGSVVIYGDQSFIVGATAGFKLAADNDKTKFVQEIYKDGLSLTASSTSVLTGLNLAHATYSGQVIEYRIKEATSNAIRIGSLLVSTDGTAATVTDTYTETADVGVTWSAAVTGGNVELTYTTTANGKTMHAALRRFLLA